MVTMIDVIISALLPIVLTLVLGFFAGWHQDFNVKQGEILNRMVMLYALPITLFAGMMGINRAVLLEQGAMAILLFIALVGGYFLTLIITRYIFRLPSKKAALLSLAIAGPSIPFIGIPVLGYLFGGLSTIPVALGSIIMNLIMVPITLFILSSDDASEGRAANLINSLKSTVIKPVVWAPVLAFVLIVFGVDIPAEIRNALQLLGGATGGVALFSSGIILFSYHVAFNSTVFLSVIVKNIVIPVAILGVGLWMGVDHQTLKMSVMTIAIPTAAICVIIAVEYETCQKEMASILFFSTLVSIVTIGCFLYYLS
jgi:predicted permease